MLKAGQIIELELESLAYEGDAVGHFEGQAVFVPFGAPGDRVRLTVAEAHQTYCRAGIAEVLSAAPQRVKPRCPHFGVCGGCQWQMLDYGAQVSQKQAILADALMRIGGIEPPAIQAVPDATGWAYRNKAQFPVAGNAGALALGYYRRGTHHIIPIDHCPIAADTVNAAWMALRETLQQSGLPGYNEARHRGMLRHVALRAGRRSGKLTLVLVTAGQQNLEGLASRIMAGVPAIESVWQNINPGKGNTIFGARWHRWAGPEYAVETIGGLELRLSPSAFVQVNLPQAEAAYRLMAQGLGLSRGDGVLDLYCGAGAIALGLAQQVRTVTGIEESPHAVADAVASAAQNGIVNCEFRSGKVEREIAGQAAADVIVLDPPRKGADKALWPEIERLRPRAMAYLSCNPATLARDAKELRAMGYRLKQLWMIDMFPQTYHVESLGIFERE
jgi:23S rRNA (uracil1939-C5)-methyltransferase